MIELPTFDECERAIQFRDGAGPPTALHRFIYQHEPAGVLAEHLFRGELAAVLEENRR